MGKKVATQSISNPNRLEEILTEVETELDKIQPRIEKLEKELEKLKELKLTKQKLITLKLSVKSIIDNFSEGKAQEFATALTQDLPVELLSHYKGKQPLSTSDSAWNSEKLFLPDRAFDEVNRILRQKNSLNYEIFRAIVFNGGRATTEQIKQYLVDNNIPQPASGDSFADVELTDISSRVNYLVRKNIVEAAGKGLFISTLGWGKEAEGCW